MESSLDYDISVGPQAQWAVQLTSLPSPGDQFCFNEEVGLTQVAGVGSLVSLGGGTGSNDPSLGYGISVGSLAQ